MAPQRIHPAWQEAVAMQQLAWTLETSFAKKKACVDARDEDCDIVPTNAFELRFAMFLSVEKWQKRHALLSEMAMIFDQLGPGLCDVIRQPFAAIS